MLPYEDLIHQGKKLGFTHVVPLRAETIELREEVRQMCRTCSAYGTRWSCPPGCGSLGDCREEIRKYSEGILVQTVEELEDELDGEGMMAAEARHKENYMTLLALLRQDYPDLLALGTGGCCQCEACTYPDHPCRLQERRVASMEAYGMLVLQICKVNGLRYYYGPRAIAYTGCFLLK